MGKKEDCKECKHIPIDSENSRFAFFCLVVTASTLPFNVGFHFSFLSPMVTTLQTVYNNTHMDRFNATMTEPTWTTLLSLSASSCVVLALFSTMTTKFILNYVSPKRVQQVAHLFNIMAISIMSLGSGITGSYEAFIFGRFISGYPMGICYVVVPMQISELSALRSKSKWLSAFGVAMSCGYLAGAILGHPDTLGSTLLWPATIGAGAIPSIIYLAASVVLPDSPYYYVRKNMMEKAEESLRKLRKGENQLIRLELNEITQEIGKSANRLLGIKEIISVPRYRNQFLGVLALLVNEITCGITHISFYSSLLFIEGGFDKREAAFAIIGISCLQFIFSCMGPKSVHKFGAFRLCIGSNILLIMALVLFVLSQTLTHLAVHVFPFISIAAVAFFMIVWSAGINIGTFALIGEITIEPTRATCMAYGNFSLWIAIWVVGFVPPYLQLAIGPYSMMLWIGFACFFLCYMCCCLPDTRGKSQEEIQKAMDGPFIKRKFNCSSSKTSQSNQSSLHGYGDTYA